MDDKWLSLQRTVPGVSRETFAALEELEDYFLRWATKINLVSPSTLNDIWTRHILDSAQLWRYANSHRWMDLGAGGGFPGLVIATLLKGSSGHISLVESNEKKASYLRNAASNLVLPAQVIIDRVECVRPNQQLDILTSRALAPLDRLLSWSEHLFGRDTKALFHKGRDYRNEMAVAGGRWSFDLLEHPSCLDGSSVILEIQNLRKLDI